MKEVAISQVQNQFWVLQNVYRDNTAYNIPVVLRLKGYIDRDALEFAVKQMILRHEALRVCFKESANEVLQLIEERDLSFIKLETTQINDPLNEGMLHPLIFEEVHKVFNLSEWPLMRVRLFVFPADTCVLTIVFHHIIVDLHSKEVFGEEFSELYNSFRENRQPDLKEITGRYSDYSLSEKQWLESDDAAKMLAEWKKYIPQTPEVLEIPADFSKPKVNNLAGTRKHFSLDEELSKKVAEFAKANSVNTFTVLLASFATFFYRITNQSEFIIGVPLSNRRREEHKDTFGCFVNIVPLLVSVTPGLTTIDLVRQIRTSMLRIHRMQELPFLMINNLLHNKGTNSVLQTGFTFEPPMSLSINNAETTSLVVERNGAQLDLFLTLWEQDSCINGYLEYSSQLFEADTISRFISIYDQIVTSAVTKPDALISDLTIISQKELQFVTELNDTDVPYENEVCIHTKFENMAKLHPERPALTGNGFAISYGEFNDHANRMANFLIGKGVEVDDKVGVCLDRSPEMMIAILGILKCGAAYVPLSPENPTDRLRTIIEDAHTRFVLTLRGSSANIPEEASVIYVDGVMTKPLSENSKNPDVSVASTSLAYVLYTSGSTGIPKGVMIEHHSVLNRLGWMQKAYYIDENDTILQKTPITFDVSVWELFWWFFNGARQVLLSKGGEKDPETLIKYIYDFKVTTIHFVPSMFATFIETLKTKNRWDKLQSLKRIFLSGEALPLKMVREFNEMRKDYQLPRLINLYGPTEATVDVSYFNCPEDNIDAVYIGRPIDNTKLFVVNDHDMIQPVGIPGELIIAGVNVARGYLNRPELTEKRFFNFKMTDGRSIKAYRSGDLVRLTPSGEIDYLGRLDNQVKIRGFRVELGEIEAKILEHPSISHCAVIVTERGEHKYLVAYVCLKPDHKVETDELRAYISGKVPDYMVPPYIVFIDTIPLTTSGKLDRKSLPLPERITERGNTIAPSSQYERRVHDLWKDILKIENISVDENFFDIGGNSIMAISLANRLSVEFALNLNTLTIFEYPTIKSQSEFLLSNGDNKADSRDTEIDKKVQREKKVSFKRYR